ncbi:uncharacterized protein PHALS_01404 [Plasmopara halstedii]|uniref:Uncharacterized protein n=1 Tax=Plasmopara halstedii TaxID=4781 RepID=A0A0P1AVK6_PLAHL|nr:uncharacterized protein PHALS_01404 [Plasmopara halstedii]CEG45078.1 hypothetical protein PHALS_01404 [Plasmopara halstedii]|eukprot:XP_024581447.1 hypothetical protein PHALS_01404 [Plasmopara halstedii]
MRQLEKISVTFLTDAMTSRFINVITGIVLGMYKLFRLIVHEEACERSRAGIRLQNLVANAYLECHTQA